MIIVHAIGSRSVDANDIGCMLQWSVHLISQAETDLYGSYYLGRHDPELTKNDQEEACD